MIPNLLLYHTDGNLLLTKAAGFVLVAIGLLLGALGFLSPRLSPLKLKRRYHDVVPERFHLWVPKVIGAALLALSLYTAVWLIQLDEAQVAEDAKRLASKERDDGTIGLLLLLVGALGWILPYRWNPFQFSSNPVKLGWVFARIVPEIHHEKVPRVVGTVLIGWGGAILLYDTFMSA